MKFLALIFFSFGISLCVHAQTPETIPQASTTTTTVTSSTTTTLVTTTAAAPSSTTTLPEVVAPAAPTSIPVEAATPTTNAAAVAETAPQTLPEAPSIDHLEARLKPRGFYAGYRFEYFDYHEPSPDVREHGPLNGIALGYESPFGRNDDAYFKVEADYLTGIISYDGHYQGGGDLQADSDDHAFNFRFNLGYSFVQETSLVRFYTGMMERYLYDYVQASGGYRREISQASIPFGMTFRKVMPRVTWSLTTEFDLLGSGIVKSHLSDVGPTHSDITNKQKTGFGGKISGTLEFPGVYTFILEPSFQYWVIDDSDLDSDGTGTYLEPYNITKMLNLSFIVRF